MNGLHIQIYGRVQGVFYRASTQEYARSLGLVGWVRNRSDGSVELHAFDPSASAKEESNKLEKLELWCKKGPSHARVVKVESAGIPDSCEFVDFLIQRH